METPPEVQNIRSMPDQPEFHVSAPSATPGLIVSPLHVRTTDGTVLMTWDEQQPSADLAEMPSQILTGFVQSAEKTVARFPESSRAFINLGIALLRNAKPVEATAALRTAVELNRNDRFAELTLADSLFHSGSFEEAGEIYSRLAADRSFLARATLGLAAISLRQGNLDAARTALNSALKALVKDNGELWFLLGLVELTAGNVNKAIHGFRVATRLGERNPAFHHALGIAYAIKKRYDDAVVAFRTALSLPPRCLDSIHALGRVLLDKGDLDEAVDVLAPLLEEIPEDDESRHLLARAYARLGRHQLAQSHFTRLLQTSQNLSMRQRILILNSLAESFLQVTKVKEAQLALTKAVKMTPHSSPVPFDNLGRLYLYRLEEPEQALDVLGEGHRLFPDSQSTTVLLAISLEISGAVRKAISLLVPFLENSVADENTYVCLGWLYGQAGEFGRAILTLKEGLVRFPKCHGIVNNLAYMYLMRGEVEEAAAVLEPFRGHALLPELVATFGLLHLWKNDEQSGRELYERAQLMAAGDNHKLKRIRQKLSLELARLYLRRGETERAKKEMSAGLAIRDFPLSFRRELLELQAEL
jgi:tetratricopeptide (TPR) repeat protein